MWKLTLDQFEILIKESFKAEAQESAKTANLLRTAFHADRNEFRRILSPLLKAGGGEEEEKVSTDADLSAIGIVKG